MPKSPGTPEGRPDVAVVGLGYVGLPTALALLDAGFDVHGIDTSADQLQRIRTLDVDLLPRDLGRLNAALDEPHLQLTDDPAAVATADVVLICVPTPVDGDRRPDMRALVGACASAVAHARAGQTFILTSTTSVGTTQELLIDPLRERRLATGADVFVAFSPERVDPGNAAHDQELVPRVVGPATDACRGAAGAVLGRIATQLHFVSSPEAAEFTKLQENTFRAVNIALANELGEACRRLDLDPVEVTEAAASKPYGYMPFFPSAGVGGHCIPCDPHYLLEGVRALDHQLPLVEHAMDAIAERPTRVAARAEEILAADGVDIRGSRVLVLGAAYKPGVRDVRESPAVDLLRLLRARGAEVAYHDILVEQVHLDPDTTLRSAPAPEPGEYDLIVVVTLQPDCDHAWLNGCGRVLDCTHRAPHVLQPELV